MPGKWKLYFVLNFLLAIPALAVLILLLISFFNTARRDTDFTILFCVSFLIIVVNNFFGILLYQRYFPGKLLPVYIKRINLTLLILTWAVVLFMTLVTGFGAFEEFSSDDTERGAAGKIAVFILSFMVILQAVILVMQVKLSNLIQRNNRKNMQELIDSIGQ
jgi:hypothetical protein